MCLPWPLNSHIHTHILEGGQVCFIWSHRHQVFADDKIIGRSNISNSGPILPQTGNCWIVIAIVKIFLIGLFSTEIPIGCLKIGIPGEFSCFFFFFSKIKKKSLISEVELYMCHMTWKHANLHKMLKPTDWFAAFHSRKILEAECLLPSAHHLCVCWQETTQHLSQMSCTRPPLMRQASVSERTFLNVLSE